MHIKRELSEERCEEMQSWQDPDMKEAMQKQARLIALIQFRETRYWVNKKYTFDEHAKKFFYHGGRLAKVRTPKAKRAKRRKSDKANQSSGTAQQGTVRTAATAKTVAPSRSKKRKMQDEQERSFIVDSGASFHLVKEADLTQRERKSIREASESQTLHTANGNIDATMIADVKVKEINTTITAWV